MKGLATRSLPQMYDGRSEGVVQPYDESVGVGSYERDARRARAGYVAALRQLARAMTTFETAGVSLEPGPGGRIEPWTDEDRAVMIACAEAWHEIVQRRQAYDSAIRALGEPGSWPHA
jgi:hypothetical protein